MPRTTPTRSTRRSVRGQSVWGSLRPHAPRGSSPGPRTEQPDHLTQQPPTKQQRKNYIIWQSTNVSGDFSLISIYIRLRCCAFVPCRGALPWCLPCCEGSQPPSSTRPKESWYLAWYVGYGTSMWQNNFLSCPFSRFLGHHQTSHGQTLAAPPMSSPGHPLLFFPFVNSFQPTHPFPTLACCVHRECCALACNPNLQGGGVQQLTDHNSASQWAEKQSPALHITTVKVLNGECDRHPSLPCYFIRFAPPLPLPRREFKTGLVHLPGGPSCPAGAL